MAAHKQVEEAKYVDSAWSTEEQAQFLRIIKCYSRGAKVSLSEAAELLRPVWESLLENKKLENKTS